MMSSERNVATVLRFSENKFRKSDDVIVLVCEDKIPTELPAKLRCAFSSAASNFEMSASDFLIRGAPVALSLEPGDEL